MLTELFYRPGKKPEDRFPKRAFLFLFLCIPLLFITLYLILRGSQSSNLPRDLYYYNQGNRYAAEGKNEKARRAYQKAIELNPRSILSYYSLGNLAFKEKDYEEALKSLNQARELAPEEPGVYLSLSKVYRANGMEAKAQECQARYEELRKEF